MKKIFFLILLAGFLMPTISESQVLVVSEQLPNKMYIYHLKFKKPKKASSMYISGEMTAKVNPDGSVVWEKISIYDSDGDGEYEYTFVTWNRLIKFYVSGEGVRWNPQLVDSPFYDEDSGCWIIGFQDGELVTRSEFKPVYPGTWGDEFIRGEIIGDYLHLYFNNNMLSEGAVECFAQLSGNGWQEMPETILNGWGWGEVKVKISKIYYQDEKGEKHYNILRLGFGGYNAKGEQVWPMEIDKSIFFNLIFKGFQIDF
jgi:hypothetical protein